MKDNGQPGIMAGGGWGDDDDRRRDIWLVCLLVGLIGAIGVAISLLSLLWGLGQPLSGRAAVAMSVVSIIVLGGSGWLLVRLMRRIRDRAQESPPVDVKELLCGPKRIE